MAKEFLGYNQMIMGATIVREEDNRAKEKCKIVIGFMDHSHHGLCIQL